MSTSGLTAPPFPPSLVAKYRPVSRLAEGGFGEVWVAEAVATGRRVAVKLPRAPGLADPEELSRFLSEARITASLAHPNVVEVLDCAADAADGPPWIVYELLPGPTLGAWLAGHRPTPAELIPIAQQIASALEAAHAAGVVHRDIKPENVLGAGEGLWKVTDFGVARFASNPVKTKTGIVLGTAPYLAPEIIRGERASPATDLYALGILLYEALTDEVPHNGADLMKVLLARMSQPAPPVAEKAPKVPPGLARLVDRMIAIDPAVRPATAAALQGELARCLDADRSAPGAMASRTVSRSSIPRAARVSTGASRSGSAIPRLAPAGATRPALRPGHLGAGLLLAGVVAAGAWFAISRTSKTSDSPAILAARSAAPADPGAPAPAASAPAAPIDPRQGDVDRAALLIGRAPVPLTRWIIDHEEPAIRVPLVVLAPTSTAALELATGVRLVSLDRLAAPPTNPLPPLAAGLHWLTFEGPRRGTLGRALELPAEPPARATSAAIDPLEEATHRELYVAAAEKPIWETGDRKLSGPPGAPGSVRGLGSSALSLRVCSEVPSFMNLLDDKKGGARVTWHVDAEEIRRRSITLLTELSAPLAAAPRWDTWQYLGWVLANTDQRPQARRAFLAALRAWPTSPWTWLELARLEERELRVAHETRAPREARIKLADRMVLAASLASRYLPPPTTPELKRFRGEAAGLHRTALDERSRLQ